MLVTITLDNQTLPAYTNVIAVTVSEGDVPTVQIIYKKDDTIHVDTVQSADMTIVSIVFNPPTPSQE